MAKDFGHTFVVLAYGKSPYLEECIQSVTSQTKASKVIVSTSTPSEYISNVAKKYSLQVNVNDHEPNICDDWNSALQVSESQFVTLAHQDDVYDSKYAELIVGKMINTKLPLIGFCESGEIAHSRREVNSRNLKVKRRLLKPLESDENAGKVHYKRRYLSLGNPIACPSVCYNLGLVQVPLFKKNYKSNLDWEAWEELACVKGSFVYVKKPLVWHRLHEGSETSQLIKNDTRSFEDLEMLKKFWPSPIAKLIFSQYRKAQQENAR